MLTRWWTSFLLLLLALALTLPVLALLASWTQFDTAAREVLAEMARSVLPDYTVTSVVLCVSVALGVAAVGMVSACAVTLFDFPGRRVFEWALGLVHQSPCPIVP